MDVTRLTHSSLAFRGIIARRNLISFTFSISLRFLTHVSRYSSGIWSSQLNPNKFTARRSSFNLDVNGVTRPRGSHTFATLPQRVRGVNTLQSALFKSPVTTSGDFPRFIFPKNKGLISVDKVSSSLFHATPTTPTCSPSADTAAPGGTPLYVIDFTPNPA